MDMKGAVIFIRYPWLAHRPRCLLEVKTANFIFYEYILK